MILKAYKYRIYPNKDQRSYLDQNFGACRFVWNQLVNNLNQYYKTGLNQPMNEIILKKDNLWLKDMISYALQQKRIDFEETKKQYFNKDRKKKLGRPKFKKKKYNNSFRIPGQQLGFNKCINFENNIIKLTKMTPIKVVIDRPFKGELRSVTVSKNSCNQYFVSCLVKEKIEHLPRANKSIGIDLGLIDLITTSNGQKVLNPKWFHESQMKLRKAQQHLSRKKRGSRRYERQRIKVARIHLKIKNQREWFLHNLSSYIVNNYDHIFMEDLNVSGIKKLFGKSISDVSWTLLINMIVHKSLWYGKTFHQIDRFYPSSKICNNCGHNVELLPLNIREWICPSCNTIHDRDINAAQNILDEGLRDLYNFTSEELSDYKRGEDVRRACKDAVFCETFSCL